MTERNWRKEQDNPFLGAWDIPEGGTLVIEFTKIEYRKKIPEFAGANKWIGTVKGMRPMVINSTNMKALEYVFGTKDYTQWLNKPVTLDVGKAKAVGSQEEVDAIRVSLKKEKVKQPIDPKRWDQAKKAVESGSWTKDKLLEEYTLTPEQQIELDAIQSK